MPKNQIMVTIYAKQSESQDLVVWHCDGGNYNLPVANDGLWFLADASRNSVA